MKIPTHRIHVYQKPKIGNQLITAYNAMRYRHKIAAMGGFDTMSCTIMVARNEAEYVYETMIGNRIAVFVDNPAAPIWEGLISRVTLNLPGIALTRSLDELANRVNVTGIDLSVANPTLPQLDGAAVNDTASQAIYGIRNGTYRRPIRASASPDTTAATIKARVVNNLAYPQASASSQGGGGQTIVEIECIGFYHTLEWELGAATNAYTYRNGSTGIIDVTLAGLANGTTFINNADVTGLMNNAQTIFQLQSGQTAWQVIQTIAEGGNGADPWVAGITGTDWNTDTRRLYYRPANLTVAYTVRSNDGARIRTTAGALIPPWTIQPDAALRLTDALVGWDGDGDDPRVVYLSFVQYDADSQRVTWQSEDNIELQGALQAVNSLTSTDQRYGQRVPNPFF
jgi:hypothetical protein